MNEQPRQSPPLTPARAAAVRVAPAAETVVSRRLGVPPPESGHRRLDPSRSAVSGSVSVAGLWEIGDRRPDTPAGGALDLTDLEPGEWAAGNEIPLWRRLTWLLQPPLELLIAPDGPLSWPAPLFPYQEQGVQTLVSQPALLLADDMGLGKMVQSIAALRVLLLQRRISSVLIVAPAGLVTQWRAQLDAWAPEPRVSTVRGAAQERGWQWRARAHVFLTGYETLRNDFAAQGDASPSHRHWDLVILDEAQRIKNRESDVSWLCKLLPRRRAWALTGTPLENSVDDLASILEFVTPLEPGKTPPVWGEGPALLARQRSIQLRRRKADVLPQLPPKTVVPVRLRLEGGQRQTYDQAEQEGVLALRRLGAGLRIEHVLELLVRLKQICNVCPRTGESAKLTDLAERLETLRAEGHRALIFSQFTDGEFGVRAIARRLARFEPLVYAGDLGMAVRDRVIETFKRDDAYGALVLSVRAGGQGLNLAEASYVVHFDRWWNPAVERQAEDRSHRLGQTLPVTVYTYICEDTIEQRIDEILRAKQALFEDLVDGVSMEAGEGLSGDELRSLFGLRP